MIRNPDGTVAMAELDGRRLTAVWHKRELPHETVVEWKLLLDGDELPLCDPAGAPTVIALHHWDEQPSKVSPRRRDDGIWEIEIPMAWHSVCVAFSGVLKLEIDVEKRRALLSEDLHVELQ